MKNIFNEVFVIMILIKERCGVFRYENVYLLILKLFEFVIFG